MYIYYSINIFSGFSQLKCLTKMASVDLTITQINKEFKRLAEIDPANTKCFDCGSEAPSWCSVSHGINVCLNCIGEHRSYGVHISFARSATMDDWTTTQMKYMQIGGNTNAAEHFKLYGISHLSKREKYHTKGAQYYRDLLKAQVEGLERPSPLPLEEGPEALPVFTRSNIIAAPISNTPDVSQPQSQGGNSRWGLSWGSVKAGFASAVATASTVATEVTSSVSTTISNNQVLNSIQQSASEGVDAVKSKYVEVSGKLNENENIRNMRQGISQATQSFSKGVDQVVFKVTEAVQGQSNAPTPSAPHVEVIDDAFNNSEHEIYAADDDRLGQQPTSNIQGGFAAVVAANQPAASSYGNSSSISRSEQTNSNKLASVGGKTNATDFFDSLDNDVARQNDQREQQPANVLTRKEKTNVDDFFSNDL